MERKVLFGFAPTPDERDRFFSTDATSVSYAAAPVTTEIDKGDIKADYVKEIYHPVNFREGASTRELVNIIEKEKVNLLALSMTYDSYYVALQLARAAKNLNPDLVTVFGGPHLDEVYDKRVMTKMPNLAVLPKHEDIVDFVIAGEGENTLKEIIKDSIVAEDPKSLKQRVSERRSEYVALDGKSKVIFSNKSTPNIIETQGNSLDLSSLPIRRRDLANDTHNYGFTCFTDGEGKLVKSTSTLSHRGCKGMCIFCSEAEPYHHRSVDNILFEVNHLKDKGYKAVFFDDSTFNDYEDYDELISRLGETGLQFGGLTRFDKLQDPREVKKLADSGFVYFYCAIEQFDDLSLRKMGKQTRTLQIDHAIENLKTMGIHLGVSILFGFPFETPESIESTLTYTANKCKQGAIDYVSMSLLTFHPKTSIMNTPEGRQTIHKLDLDRPYPHHGYPWNTFEEGAGYHPEHVTEDYVKRIAERANELMGKYLVRNMDKAQMR
jgi:anaerobic magnesium-protoporphyrin IX monomethyl ester cyclase